MNKKVINNSKKNFIREYIFKIFHTSLKIIKSNT